MAVSLLALDRFTQGGDVGPEFLPRRTLLLGQGGQSFLVAHSGQVCVLLPVGKELLNHLPRVPMVFLGQAAERAQVGLQPVEGLLTKAGAFLVLDLAGVLSLARRSQGSGAGGIV